MIVCGIFLVTAGILWIIVGKKLSTEKRKMLIIVMLATTFGILAKVTENAEPVVTEDGLLARNEYGEGSYERELILAAEGDKDELEYKVTVPEQRLTKEQEEEYLAAAAMEIGREFPGENESINHIESAVVIRDTYQEEKVMALWSFDNYEVMNYQGKIIAEELPKEGMLVKARAELSCGDTERMEEFYFRVFSTVRGEKEELLWQIGQALKKQEDARGEEYLRLPETIDGQYLTWREKSDYTSEKVLLLGMVIAACIPVLEHSRQEEQKKKRARLLELEYPEVVSKIALLLGAGMTLQGALRKIAFAYEEKKKKQLVKGMPAYEELLITCHEIENGMGESTAYERLGNRCGSTTYRKLGTILSQNLRKGSSNIVTLLEQEAWRTFEGRKAAAKKYGEEAGTKLLFPMLLMLGLVIVVLMVPAVLAFQI